MGSGFSSNNNKPAEVFIGLCQHKEWKSAEQTITNGRPEGPFNVNATFDDDSVLATFLKHTDGNQLPILERILFPPPAHAGGKPPPRCNIFNQSLRSDRNVVPELLAFHLLIASPNFKSPTTTIAPYLQLLLEAAEILPSPTKRNDPSLWKVHSKEIWSSKPSFVWKEIFLPSIERRVGDLSLFRLLFDSGLLQHNDLPERLVIHLASLPTGTAPILREMLSSGLFPDSLKTIDPPSSSKPTPLSIAVRAGNVDVVKELVANRIGGEVTDAIQTKEPWKILEISEINYEWKQSSDRHLINVLHVAASRKEKTRSGKDKIGVYDEILSLLLAMPGSGEIKNSAAPIKDKSGKTKVGEVTPAMMAAILGYESRMKLLIANGGGELPGSLKPNFKNFSEWAEHVL